MPPFFAASIHFRFQDPQLHAKYLVARPRPVQDHSLPQQHLRPEQQQQQLSYREVVTKSATKKKKKQTKTKSHVKEPQQFRPTPPPPPLLPPSFDKDDLKRLRRLLFDMIVECTAVVDDDGSNDAEELGAIVQDCQFEEIKSGVPIVNDFHFEWIVRDTVLDLSSSVEFLVHTDAVSWDRRYRAVTLPTLCLDLPECESLEDNMSSQDTAQTSLLSIDCVCDGYYSCDNCSTQDEQKEEYEKVVTSPSPEWLDRERQTCSSKNDDDGTELSFKSSIDDDWKLYLRQLKARQQPQVHPVLEDIIHEHTALIQSPCICPDKDYLPSCLCKGCCVPGMYEKLECKFNQDILNLPPCTSEEQPMLDYEAWAFSILSSSLDLVSQT